MKVYVVYNSTLHLSASQSIEKPNTYISLCGATKAHDIRDYAKNGGAEIYAYSDVRDSKIGTARFETNICERCFRESRGTLNEVPPKFRDGMLPDAQGAGSPSSVATDGGEIEDYIGQTQE